MKKILTAMTAMSMTLQASDNLEETVDFSNAENTNNSNISDILQSDNFDQPILEPTTTKSFETNEETLGGSGSFINVVKEVYLTTDVDSSGTLTEGDVLFYFISVRGASQVIANDVVMYDVLDPNTTLIAGAVTAYDGGQIIEGNKIGDTKVTVDFGSVGINYNYNIGFLAFVNDINVAGSLNISNQALVETSNLGSFVSDDPFTFEFGDPTIITALSKTIFKAGFE